MTSDQNQNQNSLLVKRQNDNTSPGDWPIALTREVNSDTQSSDSSAEDDRVQGIAENKLLNSGKIFLDIFVNIL